jgi:3',5'-cyclic-AMP phosphodiesterase
MATFRIAHLSDLHVGLHRDAAIENLCAAVAESRCDVTLLTGDITHRGKRDEFERFRRAFAPLLENGSVAVVPGNHDRLSDDVGAQLMPGARVQAYLMHGTAWLVRIDSTAPHNRRIIDGHGLLTASDLDDVDRALGRAPPGTLVIAALHHHPLPLPDEDTFERLSTWLGWPNAAELARGPELLDVLRGRCDLVLHGHRHTPSDLRVFGGDRRPLRVLSAGSSVELDAFRIFEVSSGYIQDRWVRCEDLLANWSRSCG